MKIEMGESLLASWLRHEKGCQIVQTNWAVDAESISETGTYPGLEEILGIIQGTDFYNELGGDNNFDRQFFKDLGLEQVLRQAECDVIGVKINNDVISEVHAVDVAFHEGGLLYGSSKKETHRKVIEKCLRTALSIYGGLGRRIQNVHVYFATPKISPQETDIISKSVKYCKKLFPKIAFNLLANDGFSQIITNVLDKLDNIHDTNELFVRSMKLMKMSGIALP